jgi:3-oxoacyl-[acyl-carrier protein] reductase
MKKIAIVTGASRGIGQGVADKLISSGFFVVGTSTSREGAERISKRITEAGLGMQLDIANTESIERFVDEIKERFDPPLALINNAGITRDNIALRMKNEEWDDVIETNLSGLFRITKAFLKGMIKARWGRIVNISSVVGSMGNPGQSNYAASKAGLEGYTRALSLEVGSRGITVNSVAPGFIKTDMTEKIEVSNQRDMLDSIPLGRFGEVAEVAALVSFLCDDAASYITGETIHINGGMYRS